MRVGQGLKKVLKQRIFTTKEEINPCDWIYFKNKTKRWEGPVKVTMLSGKLLYAINADHATLVRSRDDGAGVLRGSNSNLGIKQWSGQTRTRVWEEESRKWKVLIWSQM